jgi:ABC-type multidrug transport system fused ATPase/permease subunit
VGQRQRVCIARALAGSPALLVLDEPTSALDPASELAVRDTLESLRGRVTVLVVAHRLETISVCDRVLRLDEGRLLEVEPRGYFERFA